MVVVELLQLPLPVDVDREEEEEEEGEAEVVDEEKRRSLNRKLPISWPRLRRKTPEKSRSR